MSAVEVAAELRVSRDRRSDRKSPQNYTALHAGVRALQARDNLDAFPSGAPAQLSRCNYTLSACSYKKIAIYAIVASDAQEYHPSHVVAGSKPPLTPGSTLHTHAPPLCVCE